LFEPNTDALIKPKPILNNINVTKPDKNFRSGGSKDIPIANNIRTVKHKYHNGCMFIFLYNIILYKKMNIPYCVGDPLEFKYPIDITHTSSNDPLHSVCRSNQEFVDIVTDSINYLDDYLSERGYTRDTKLDDQTRSDMLDELKSIYSDGGESCL